MEKRKNNLIKSLLMIIEMIINNKLIDFTCRIDRPLRECSGENNTITNFEHTGEKYINITIYLKK